MSAAERVEMAEGMTPLDLWDQATTAGLISVDYRQELEDELEGFAEAVDPETSSVSVYFNAFVAAGKLLCPSSHGPAGPRVNRWAVVFATASPDYASLRVDRFELTEEEMDDLAEVLRRTKAKEIKDDENRP
jgi:hypothetical protein